MPDLSVSGVALRGVCAAVPHTTEDNADCELLSEKARKEIVERVGVRFRHIADADTTAADLCQAAAETLLHQLNWRSDEVGVLVLVTQTPDHTVPGSASQLQFKLGLDTNAISLDINQGCAGYVYGMSVISAMMKSFGIRKGLLLVGDTITKMISRKDSSIWPIFSDAGSATAFELGTENTDMRFRMGSKGDAFEAIHVPSGGFRYPVTAQALQEEQIAPGVVRAANQLSMNGQAVFTFGLSTVAKEIRALLADTGEDASSIDHLILHQANQFLNDAIARKVGFGKEQTPSSLYEHGNTSCATIPVTLVSSLQQQLISERLKLLLSGFGVGLSWGNVILTTENVVVPKLIIV